VIYCCKIKKIHETCWDKWTMAAISASRLKRFFAQAIPAAMVGLVEQAQFVFITLLVGTLGDHKTELAAHSGMLNVFSLVSCFMYGLTDAGASTVGLLLGAGEPQTAKKSGKVLLQMMTVMSASVAVSERSVF